MERGRSIFPACIGLSASRYVHLLLFFLLIFFFQNVHGQKFLQLEKAGTLKTKRFTRGDALVFKLKNDDKGWYTRVINDLDADNGKIIFANSVLFIDSIEAIRLSNSKILNLIGLALQAGGANTILFSLFYSGYQERKVDWVSIGTGVGNIVVGAGVRTLLARKVFKPGKYKRLRILDLSPPGRTGLENGYPAGN